MANVVMLSAEQVKTWVLLAKADKPCMDCGGKFALCAMDFDHARGEKLFSMSQYRVRSVDELNDELVKCDLVCANCHRVRTASRPARQTGAPKSKLRTGRATPRVGMFTGPRRRSGARHEKFVTAAAKQAAKQRILDTWLETLRAKLEAAESEAAKAAFDSARREYAARQALRRRYPGKRTPSDGSLVDVFEHST